MTLRNPDAIEWASPPDPKGGQKGGKTAAILAALKDAPGQWAIVADGNSASGAASVGRSLRQAGCEVTSRNVSGGKAVLYARWPA